MEVSGLVTSAVWNIKASVLIKKTKKTDHDAKKIKEIEKKQLEHDHNNKCVTTQEINRLTALKLLQGFHYSR